MLKAEINNIKCVIDKWVIKVRKDKFIGINRLAWPLNSITRVGDCVNKISVNPVKINNIMVPAIIQVTVAIPIKQNTINSVIDFIKTTGDPKPEAIRIDQNEWNLKTPIRSSSIAGQIKQQEAVTVSEGKRAVKGQGVAQSCSQQQGQAHLRAT